MQISLTVDVSTDTNRRRKSSHGSTAKGRSRRLLWEVWAGSWQSVNEFFPLLPRTNNPEVVLDSR